MNLIITDGFYESVSFASLINDPDMNFVKSHMTDYMLSRAVDPDAYKKYNQAISAAMIEPFPIEHWEKIGRPVFGTLLLTEPGYLYLSASVNELRKCPNSKSIFLRLKAKTKDIVDMVIYPKQLGYAIDKPGDIQISWLITRPHIATPRKVIVTDYDQNSYLDWWAYDPEEVTCLNE